MAKNIIEAFEPLGAISKFCGFSMFTVNGINFSVAFKRMDFLFQIWIILINFYLNFNLWDLGQHHMWMHKSDILSRCLPIILCASYLVYVFTIFALVASRKKQSILIQSICEIDEMLGEFGIEVDYDKDRRIVLFTSLLMVLMNVLLVGHIYGVQYMHSLTSSFGYNPFAYYWILQSYSVLIMNFVFMARTVQQRFTSINECLIRKTLKIEDVQMLATIHQNLTEVINIINQVYSVLLMFYFCGIFCAMNLFVFGLVITRAYYTTHSEVVIMTMANFEWNMYDMIMVFFVIRYSVAASEEGKKAMNLIYKIVNTSMDGKLNGRLMNFAQQIASSRFDFSCGLFNYDWPLCFKLISATVMGLVILIQFDSALSKNGAK